ncbi:MAG TPA: hypothetical protein PLF10_13020, partial [Dokdonella sp.]|nr:hypothetical protein [Dokdonella sp.]
PNATDLRPAHPDTVIPAKAGIHFDLGHPAEKSNMDPGFRRDDELKSVPFLSDPKSRPPGNPDSRLAALHTAPC